MTKIEELIDKKEQLTKELEELEAQINEEKNNDLKFRFNLQEGQYYKIVKDTCTSIYFKYTKDVYLKSDILFGGIYIEEISLKNCHYYMLGESFSEKIVEDPKVSFNTTKEDNQYYSLLPLKPILLDLYDPSIKHNLKIELVDLETIKSIKNQMQNIISGL